MLGIDILLIRHADNLNLKGYTQNLFSGEVVTEVEGEFGLINELIKQLKIGPMKSHVTNCVVDWTEYKNEFKRFEVRY